MTSESEYLPYNYVNNGVVYTGTHDNETLVGWYKGILDIERKTAREYLNDAHTPDEEIYWNFIAEVMKSHAGMCIVPMQDYLGLDNDCRMNQPSTVGKNWRWRLIENQLTEKLKNEILKTTRIFGRV